MIMCQKWSKQKAWDWYNHHQWIRGCNFIGSDCANRIDQWQKEGFDERIQTAEKELQLVKETGFNTIRIIVEYDVWREEHDSFMQNLERYISTAAKQGISCAIVLANDCCISKKLFKKSKMGPQSYDIGYHGGRKNSPHINHGDELSYSIIDDPETAKFYMNMVCEIVDTYKNDERILFWNVLNEPGNGRGDRSVSFMKQMFKEIRRLNTIQPLTADIWSDIDSDGIPISNAEQQALELSDIISFHHYGNFVDFVKYVSTLKKHNRPMICTEWLHRIMQNNVKEIFPYLYSENIGAYNWGFVASHKTQYYEPWESLWENYYNPDIDTSDLDMTKWQHDLFRPNLRPYDPKEIEIIKEICTLADNEFNKK